MTKYKGSLELNWINKDKSLLYEIDEDEGVGIKPTWVEKDDIRVAEPRILKLKGEYGNPNNENMLIKGDNLLALHTLVEEFKGRDEKDKVKCVYIDPPFNTGNAFEYYDDNLEHSQWLTMMRDRLFLLRQILREDGAIFVHIDYIELGYLIVLMNEIFGRKNFVQLISVKTAAPAGFKTVNPGPIDVTEYVLFYTKNRSDFKFKKLFLKGGYDTNYRYIINNFNFGVDTWELEDIYSIIYKKAGIKSWDNPKTRWREAKEKFGEQYTYIIDAMVADFALKNKERVVRLCDPQDAGGLIKETIQKSKQDRDKIFKLERERYDDAYICNGGLFAFYDKKVKEIDGERCPTTLLTDFWSDIAWEGIQNEGQVKFKKSKKPEKLIKRIIEMSTEPRELVFDSFLGSGTTVSVAHKMGRAWIGIELGKHADTLCIPRLNRVIRKEDPSGITNIVNWKGGGGFRYYEVGESIIKDLDMNWDMTLEEMSKAVFMNFDYSIIEGSTYNFEANGDKFHLGRQKGGIAICLVTKGIKIIHRPELNKMIKDLSKKYGNQKITIFTNMGVAVKNEGLGEKLDVKKIPESILKKYRMV